MILNHIQYRIKNSFSSFIRSFVHSSFTSKCHPLHPLHLLRLLPPPLPMCLLHSSINLGIPQVRRIWNWNSNCAKEK